MEILELTNIVNEISKTNTMNSRVKGKRTDLEDRRIEMILYESKRKTN